MGVNSLHKTVTRQRRDCDLNPGPSAPKSSTLTTRLPSHPARSYIKNNNRKKVFAEYAELTAAHEFQPVAVETNGPMDEATISFISESGRRVSEYPVDPFDSRYFFQRVSVIIQRYNSILFRETFPAEDEIDM